MSHSLSSEAWLEHKDEFTVKQQLALWAEWNTNDYLDLIVECISNIMHSQRPNGRRHSKIIAYRSFCEGSATKGKETKPGKSFRVVVQAKSSKVGNIPLQTNVWIH
jgi:hypothetical protein